MFLFPISWLGIPNSQVDILILFLFLFPIIQAGLVDIPTIQVGILTPMS